MHSYVQNAMLKSINIADVMDTYAVNDLTDKPNSNFVQQWSLLAPYFAQVPTYKWFSQAEVAKWKLKPELWQALDKARELSGIPYSITSGFRTPQQNTAVGGVDGSEHTLGLGCDILADTSTKRLKIVSGALKAGFTRIGVYLNHIHLGLGQSPSFDQNVLWVINKD